MMSKITSRVNALRGCVINWCEDQEEKQTMIMCADEVLEYIDKLEKQQEFQLTVEEIDLIITLLDLERQRCNIHKNYNRYTEALMILINKLKKQKEVLENVR